MISIVFISVIFIVLIIIGAMLVIAVSSNSQVGQRFRENLAKRLEQLPFYKMLQKRNADVTNYLNETPIKEVESQLNNCEDCEKVEECDAALSTAANEPVDYSFCKNDPVIEKLEKNKDVPPTN